MSGVNRGNRTRSVDSSGIIRSMSTEARGALQDTVRRHREHRGWSRPQMAQEANERFGEGQVVLSSSTVRNIETKTTEVTGTKAGVLERLFGWQTGTVANILAGATPPEPWEMDAPEPASRDDERSWATFRSWPKDVQDYAMYFGALLELHDGVERRRELANLAFGALLDTSI
jgi:hypothetical protein